MTAFSVHSMGNELTHPDWPEITLDERQFIQQHYPQLGQIQTISWYSPRPFSTTCIAQTPSGQVIIKRHDARLRSCQDITQEHAFIRHLSAHDIPVSLPLCNTEYVSVIGNTTWTYELFNKATGDDIYRDAISWSPFQHTNHAYAAGIALAQLHLASATYTAPTRTTMHLMASDQFMQASEPEQPIHDWISQHSVVQQWLNAYSWQTDIQRHVIPYYAQLQPFKTLLRAQWGHNDWHASNLLWSASEPKQVTTVIDFGLSNKTSALYDIATAIERNMVDWLSLTHKTALVDYQSLQAFLQGYQTISPLTHDMRHTIAALMPVVHVEYALSEIDYFLTITDSASNADIAYKDYLLGHAQWFLSHEAKTLQQTIITSHSAGIS